MELGMKSNNTGDDDTGRVEKLCEKRRSLVSIFGLVALCLTVALVLVLFFVIFFFSSPIRHNRFDGGVLSRDANGTFFVNYDDVAPHDDLDNDNDTLVNATSTEIEFDEKGRMKATGWIESYPVLAFHNGSTRSRRSVLDLASMIRCYTDCSPFSYKDYGCYCGLGGSGPVVDGIDACCYLHDKCYTRAFCNQTLLYFKNYKWRCRGPGKGAACSHANYGCARELCECDRAFAKCLAKYPCPRGKPVCPYHENSIFDWF